MGRVLTRVDIINLLEKMRERERIREIHRRQQLEALHELNRGEVARDYGDYFRDAGEDGLVEKADDDAGRD